MPARLKSLELQGYKTFASRTKFEFASTVTAIVGPNGSGKSNLSDSLRWVLGEQSYSLLRAKKTEDLIFSGSEQRPRASMASATITFDNTDGWLPIDFTEVAITRRAYRDGDNEYLLNGQRVRLRDVSELLAQSGLAERTYTIIGQGLVDVALALKAEERRRLFEEAAGIGLHRSRREEALKRLETTARNLERVQDILSELQPRLRSLERQARRAQEYDQVKADLRLMLREWYGYHWHRTQKDLAEAREVTRSRETVLDRARQDNEEQSEKLAAVIEGIHELRGRLGAWHRQSAQLHTRREALSRELAVAEERERAYGVQCQETSAEILRLGEEHQLSQEMVESATGEVAQLQGEFEEARTQEQLASQALGEGLAERGRMEKELQEARQDLSTLTARQAHLQARLAERKANGERQEEAFRAAAEAISRNEKDLAPAEKALAEAGRILQEARSERLAVESHLAELRQKISEAENARREARERRAVLDSQIARLRAQKDVLEAAEKNLTGYSSGVKLLVEAARRSDLDGVRGVLSSLLELPAELETAVTAALGEFVDAVILEGNALEENAGAALDLLRDQRARGALLPLKELESVEPAPASPILQAGEGVIGLASELVGAPEDLRRVVDTLLGSVWVVKDRESARRCLEILRQEDGNSRWLAARVVTIQGEVFYAAGPILAGTAGEAIIRRPRQIRELRTQLDQLEHQMGELEHQIGQLDRSRNQFRDEETQQSQELKRAQDQEERLRSAHSQSDLLAEKARRQLQFRREEQSRLEAEMKGSSQESARISAQVADLDPQIGQARQKLHAINEHLAGLALEELQTRQAHWNTRSAVAERAAAEATRRLAERQAALETIVRTRHTLQSRLVELQASLEKLESGKGLLRNEEGLVSQELEGLRKLIEPAEAQLEAEEREQAGLQTLEAAARQSMSLAEHHHAQARILLARRQEALDSLQRRIEDDFGLVSFEYAEEISGQATLPLDGMVELLPVIHDLSSEIEETIKRQRAQLRRMGPVNPEAQEEYQQVKERFDFLTVQVADLVTAESDVKQVIAELDQLMQREFDRTFHAVAAHFVEIFTRLFGGGTARLVLTDPEDLTSTGIEIEARLPGRRTQVLSLLSGGERSLTATALIFALLKVSPTPFCVLDEVDAMLDEANVGRFRDLLQELSQNTQFVVVTHNRNTVQVADVIYGVTMGRDSVSQVLSLKLDEVGEVVG